MSYFFTLLPPWVGWLIGALMWAALGWLFRGSLGAWFFFVMTGVYCIVAAISWFRRGDTVNDARSRSKARKSV